MTTFGFSVPSAGPHTTMSEDDSKIVIRAIREFIGRTADDTKMDDRVGQIFRVHSIQERGIGPTGEIIIRSFITGGTSLSGSAKHSS